LLRREFVAAFYSSNDPFRGQAIMDVNYARRLSGLAGLLLAMVCPSGLAAEAEAIASDNPSNDVVVLASDEPGDVELPPEAPSALVISSDGDEAPAVDSADDDAATLTISDNDSVAVGELRDAPAQASRLSVVANQERQLPLTPVAADPAVTPASSVEAVDDHNFYAEGPFGCEDEPLDGAAYYAGGPQGAHYASRGVPIRQRIQQLGGALQPHPATTQVARRRPTQRPATRSDAARTEARLASNNRPAATVSKPKANATRTAQPRRQPASNSPSDLLVRAHELSQTASTEAEYSQIVKWCTQALRQKLDDETRKYAEQLSAWALNRRGQLLADEGQKDLALADFQTALAADPDCWRALHNRGVTFAQGGQFAEAFDDICRVIELNPNFAKAYSNRATLYVQAKDLENALADYDKAIELDPKLTAARVGRGRVRHIQGRLGDAIDDLTAAAKLAPNDAEIVCSRADLLADLGRYNEAVEDYARAIDLNPHFEHAFRNGSWLLATCPDESVRDAEGALAGAQAALDCGYGERHAALDTLAAALANAGRYEEAVGTIQQAIDIAPEELHAVYEVRQELYESGQPFRTRPVKKVDVQTAEYTED
jgi:tetratricopeptide (TPR) repeat protein